MKAMLRMAAGILLCSSALVESAIGQNTYPWPSSGNVGIGATSPFGPLVVNAGSGRNLGIVSDAGQLGTSGVAVGSFNDTASAWEPLSILGSTIALGGGKVGIGTTSPATLLHLFGAAPYTVAIGNSSNPAIRISNNSSSNYGEKAELQFAVGGGNTTTAAISAWYSDWLSPGGSSVGSDLVFSTKPASGSVSERMRITSAGNVGIGTTSPQYNLDVAGSVHASGPVYYQDGSQQTTAWTGVLCGGDYSEAMNAAGGKAKYEPGDVLILAAGGNGSVGKSQEPYSTMVAGIYATKPGVVGRRASLSKNMDEVPMAMIGVVPTKVSTENGPIHLGDLLVTASKPGFAMKGTDHSRMLGAVIGKAMSDLDAGVGVMEVLVTLQ